MCFLSLYTYLASAANEKFPCSVILLAKLEIMNTSDFLALMQKLPIELVDEIFNLVFHVQNGTRTINEYYRFPVQLEVDSLSRFSYAHGYYGKGSTFALDRRTQIPWAHIIPLQHFDQIRRIEYPLTSGNFLPGALWSPGRICTCWLRIHDFEMLLRCFGYRLLSDLVNHPGRAELQFWHARQRRLVVWLRNAPDLGSVL